MALSDLEKQKQKNIALARTPTLSKNPMESLQIKYFLDFFFGSII